MTGTGTIEDPFIVSNWEEIASALTDSEKYVKCIPDLIIDWNDIDPEGQMDTIYVKCKEFDANGLTISGFFRDKNVGLLNCDKTVIPTIKNLNILNCQINNGCIFYTNSSTDNSVKLKNTIITGTVTGQYSSIFGNGRALIYYSYIDIKLYGQSYIFSTASLYHTVISSNPMDDYSTIKQLQIRGNDFLILGKHKGEISITPSDTYRGIIDCYVGGFISASSGIISNMLVINIDKNEPNNKFINATTAQLSDPVALANLGFPIGG